MKELTASGLGFAELIANTDNFLRKNFLSVTFLCLIAAFGRFFQEGGNGEISGILHVLLEVAVLLARVTVVLLVIGHSNLNNGVVSFMKVFDFKREAWRQTWQNIKNNFIYNRSAVVINYVVFVAIAIIINITLFMIVSVTPLIAFLKEQEIIATSASKWPVLLFAKNLTVIPFALVFETLFVMWITQKNRLFVEPKNTLPLETRNIPAEDLKSIHIATFIGDIELIGTDEENVRIEISASNRLLQNLFQRVSISSDELTPNDVIIKKENDSLKIISQYKDFWIWNWLTFFKLSFRVFVPKNINSTTKSSFGFITLHNLNGKHSLRTSFGTLMTTNVKGEMNGKSAGGNIKVHNCDAKVEFSTAGGNLFIQNSKGEMNFSTSGGNIRIDGFTGKIYTKTSGGNVKANGVSGEFKTLTFGGYIRLAQMDGNVGASTKGGNISIQALSIKEYLWLETSGGNIISYLPLNQGLHIEVKGTRIRAPFIPNFQGIQKDRYWAGTINGGGASVNFRTSGGKIRINPIEFSVMDRRERRERFFHSPDKQNYEGRNEVNVNPVEDSSPEINPVYTEEKIGDRKKNRSSRFKFKTFFAPLNPSFLLYTLVFVTFFVYGLNSVLYFSLELLNPTSSEADQNKAVFLANLTVGFTCFVSLTLFISFFERFFTRNWVKYLILIAFTYILLMGGFVWQRLLFFTYNDGDNFWKFYWRLINFDSVEKPISLEGNLFSLIPMVVVSVFFYSWQRSRNLNRKISEQEYQLLNLEKLKTKAQLNALEARINPHFLYNSLNSIAGLIHDNPDKAEEMTIQLSKLFRFTTGRSEESFHTIGEELEIVKAYLSIEQVRFGDRLRYAINIEKGLENIKVSRFLLQPIVENAIKHGISKIAEHGVIEVNIAKVEDDIVLKIHDNGPDFQENLGGGFGLKSIKDKLRLIYGNEASLEIANTPKKTVIITISQNHES